MPHPVPPTTQFPFEDYYKGKYTKNQIFLHHTAGNDSGKGVYRWWEKDKGTIGTCVVISGDSSTETKDGEIIQGFSSKFWAYHLGLRSKTFAAYNLPYKALDKYSIGVEICNWGYLIEKADGFYTYVDTKVDESEVIELTEPFKGFKYWHNYTDAQIASVKELLLYWRDFYGIPLKFNEDIFSVTPRALRGEAGIYTHNSVRADKFDIYPHPKLIDMLKNLENEEFL